MKKAGLVVAIEMNALQRKFGKALEEITYRNEKIFKYHVGNYELYVVRSGVGEIAAAIVSELLINRFDVEVIFNFGVVGGLTEEISKHRLCVVEKVVHYDFDTSALDHCEVGHYTNLFPTVYIPVDEELLAKAVKIEPSLKKVICASADKFVDEAEKRIYLHEMFKADICEMEAAGISLCANRNNVPCLMIKMVSDGIDGGADEFVKELENASDIAVNTLAKILEDC